MVSAVLPQIDAGIWLLSEHFAIAVGAAITRNRAGRTRTASLVMI